MTVERDQEDRKQYEATLHEPVEDRAASGAAAPEAVGPGTHVGQYRIESLLGQGGMGVVYRATCTKLNRPAAVKFLSSQLADVDARRRFQREAQTASSLNHPHIVTVYDTGDYQDRQYLVTEFVDGGTLREWAREPHDWRQVVELLVGVADGLAAAHEAQIVHRDIKPANILVARNGYAKLADFGLAKLADAGGRPEDLRGAGFTRTGAVIGTIEYMSPEQAAGRPLDARSDVFSFGAVLYELLAGRQPFDGASDYDRLKAVVDREPEPLPDDLPEALRTLVDKALAKNPAERYQSMREMVVDLRRLASRPQRSASQTVARPQQRKSSLGWRVWGAIGVAAAVVFALALGLWRAQPSSVEPENPLAGAQFTRLTDFPGDETNASISPDGRFVVFVSDRDGPLDYWLGQIGAGRFQNLTMGSLQVSSRNTRQGGFAADGSEIWLGGAALAGSRMRLLPLMGGPSRPFLGESVVNVDWSPDGARIAYHTNDTGDPLFVADRDGANARQIFVGPSGTHNHFPTWSSNGEWLYFVSRPLTVTEADLWRIPATGGAPERLTETGRYLAFPTPLDERTVLFVGEDEEGGGPWVWVLDVESKVTRRITLGLERYTSLAASADRRRLVAAVANPVANLWSVPIFDRPAREGDVDPYPVPTARALAPRFGGAALYYLSSIGGGDGLWRVEDGQAAEIWRGAEGALLEPPGISADGLNVAVVVRRSGKQRLWILRADGSEPRALTDTVEVSRAPSWSPDGQWIATGGIDADGPGLFKIPVGGGAAFRLAGNGVNPVWSPTDELIVYMGPNVGGDSPLLAVTADGDPVELPPIHVRDGGARVRFLPSGEGFVYMQGGFGAQDFWLFDLATRQSRRLTELATKTDTMRTFDITPDGKQIVFDRLRQNSDIVLIDLPQQP
jgi:serine/threonine protein kinase